MHPVLLLQEHCAVHYWGKKVCARNMKLRWFSPKNENCLLHSHAVSNSSNIQNGWLSNMPVIALTINAYFKEIEWPLFDEINWHTCMSVVESLRPAVGMRGLSMWSPQAIHLWWYLTVSRPGADSRFRDLTWQVKGLLSAPALSWGAFGCFDL